MFIQLQVLVSKGKKITKPVITQRTEEVEKLCEQIFQIPDEVRGHKKIVRPRASGLRDDSRAADASSCLAVAVCGAEVAQGRVGHQDGCLRRRDRCRSEHF